MIFPIWSLRFKSGKRPWPAGDGWPGSPKNQPDLHVNGNRGKKKPKELEIYSSGHITGSSCATISLLDSSNEKLTMLLDTGASKNVIKKGCLPPDLDILGDEILKLSGITEGVTCTLGYVKIPSFGRIMIFNVVHNDFSIQQSGILSSEFFSDNSTEIDYENQVFEVCGKRYSFRTGEVMAFTLGERRLFFA